MDQWSRVLADGLMWMSAAMFVLTPIVMALDFGGTLRWTQYVGTMAVVPAIAMVLIATLISRGWQSLHVTSWHLAMVLLVWCLYGWSQTLVVDEAIVATLSPASATARSDWAAPILETKLEEFPISVAPTDSMHCIAMLVVTAAIVWASGITFDSRPKAIFLVIAVSIGAAIISVIGLINLTGGLSDAWWVIDDAPGKPFGTFLNRNNAGLFMNLGLGTSLGILAWRLNALTTQDIDDPNFEMHEILSLIGDRDAQIAMICGVACMAGILASGSRGTVVTTVFAFCTAAGWVRQRRAWLFQTLLAVGLVAIVALSLLPISIQWNSLDRLSEMFKYRGVTDGRLSHWPDGWDAAIAYFPGGSGLSTYAYSHLPFLRSSQDGWYHHADNLWLEMLVEQGVAGIIFSLAIVALILRSLLQLTLSTDPFDQGIRILGWYVLTSVIVSQIFDYGLILPANLWIVAILFALVVSRSSPPRILQRLWNTRWLQKMRPEQGSRSNGRDPDQTIPKPSAASQAGMSRTSTLKHPSALTHLAPIACGATLLVLCLVAQTTLRNDVTAEDFRLQTSGLLPTIAGDETRLQSWIQDLDVAAMETNDPSMDLRLSDFYYELARLREVEAAQPMTSQEAVAYYEITEKTNRRLILHPSTQPNTSRVNATPAQKATIRNLVINDEYRLSLEAARSAIRKSPLDPAARASLIYLDFVDRNVQRTDLCLDQLARFYFNDEIRLLELGKLAADTGYNEKAIRNWKTAMELKPALIHEITIALSNTSEITLEQVLPKTHESYLAAAPILLRDPVRYRQELTNSLKIIQCDQCETDPLQAACYRSLHQIALVNGQAVIARQMLETAVARQPLDPELRWQLIQFLEDQGQPALAAKQLRLGRGLFPTDKRFQTAVELIESTNLK